MKINPAVNGLLKGLFLSLLTAFIAYFAVPGHLDFLTGSAWAWLIPVIVSLASSFESSIKDQTGRGLFGAVRVR